MKTNKNISIDIDLVDRVNKKMGDPRGFSALVTILLNDWLKPKARSIQTTPGRSVGGGK